MMGPEAMGVANANLVWSDEKVCRNFLCGTCPHTLFTNTKMDLGACPKSHTERLKTNSWLLEKLTRTTLYLHRELQQLQTLGASGHQKLRVCDVCGAYLSVLDSDRRLADHFGGKMHLGYHELRNMLSKFKEEREKRKNAAPGGGGDRDYRSREEPRERDRGYERHGSARYEYVFVFSVSWHKH
ncbi:hypothetical protein BC629DRAFT_1463274 [Irpex lacteus]|nr:hypothetical protein BC629DRAFT_1463274 [Irpex lacteus]